MSVETFDSLIQSMTQIMIVPFVIYGEYFKRSEIFAITFQSAFCLFEIL